jgi:hypothetical protein
MARGLVTGDTIHVEGLGALLRSFGRMDPIMRRELRRELLAVADVVAEKARSYAVGAGLVDDEDAPPGGGLVDTIKPSIRGAAIAVVDTARRVSRKYPAGYPYPARFEFEQGGARAFMRPAASDAAPAAATALEAVFARMASESGFGGGIL